MYRVSKYLWPSFDCYLFKTEKSTLLQRLLKQVRYICFMSQQESASSLSHVNFITGMSDGLLLPYGVCLVLMPLFAASFEKSMAIGFVCLTIGAVVFGWARFSGEKNEIHHNHPALAAEDAEKEKELMLQIGIEEKLTDDMQAQMTAERALWLKEITENKMGWEKADNKRAFKSALQTAFGFLLGGGSIFGALYISLRLMQLPMVFIFEALLLLIIFGAIKGGLVGKSLFKITSLQLLLGLGITVSAIVISYLLPLHGPGLLHLLFLQ
jgi:VIT1/CCC1 family predicted Fe2+/Mn2+ transporter